MKRDNIDSRVHELGFNIDPLLQVFAVVQPEKTIPSIDSAQTVALIYSQMKYATSRVVLPKVPSTANCPSRQI